jgi:hypothetical protein
VIGWLALVVVVHRWGSHLIDERGRDALRLSAPPLVGWIDPSVGWPLAVTAAAAAATLWISVRLLPHLSWRAVVGAACALSVAWAIALALARSPVAGTDPSTFTTEGLTQPLVLPGDEYLLDVPLVGDDPQAFLEGFTTDIDRHVTHVRSHPPLFLLVLWGLDRAGLGGTGPAAALVLAGWAAAVAGVLAGLRSWRDEDTARAAAPFVALLPGVLWAATTADAFFAGVAVWAVTLAMLATDAADGRSRRRALGAGILAGTSLLLSYGLVLLAVPLLIVLGARRRWDLVVPLAVGALVPIAVAWLAGFSWLDGLAVARREYSQSVASTRPQGFFLWSNLAALAVVVGPATAAGLARLRDRSLWILLGGFGAAILMADLSGMSKGEVERIWLPFAVWLPVAAVALTRRTGPGVIPSAETARATTWWLGAQLSLAIAVQVLVRTRW